MAEPIRELYQAVIAAWNERDGGAMARPFAADGIIIGFDGSVHSGSQAIAAQLDQIVQDHPTARYVTKVEGVRPLGRDAAMLRAIAGLVPPGQTRVKAEVNAHRTVVAERRGDGWELVLYQNTPARFHGRPELVAQITATLQEVADQG